MRVNVSKLMKAIQNHIEKNIPTILEGSDLEGFEIYQLKYPTNQNERFFCIRYAEHRLTDVAEFTFTIHVNLQGMTEEELYKYIDAVSEYLDDVFDPMIFGYVLSSYIVAVTDVFKTSTASIFFDVTMTRPLDDNEY